MSPVESGPPKPDVHPPQAIADIAWSDAGRILFSGACMGTADLVPGVSGGTMAVALGIYRSFLGAIDSVTAAVRGLRQTGFRGAFYRLHWRFILCLGVGMLVAIILMGKVVGLPDLVSTNPKPVYAVFFGLVLASSVVLLRQMKSWSLDSAVTLLVGAVVGFIIVQLVPVQTPENAPFVFLCGVIAITAMILPGISGSFMLLVLGKYEYVIGGALSLRLGVIVPFGLGCLLGITTFSRLLGWLLDRYPNRMMAGLTGLLLGSLVRIWPYQDVRVEMIRDKARVVEASAIWPETIEWWVPLLMVAGFLLVLGLEMLARQRSLRLDQLSAPSTR